MNLHIPMAVCLTASLLAGCTQKHQQPDTQPHPTALNGNVQPARQDVYAASPEVVRYDRYLLIDTSPSAAQRAPLEQTIDIRIPASLSPTVADAMRYALRRVRVLAVQYDTGEPGTVQPDVACRALSTGANAPEPGITDPGGIGLAA